MGDEKTESEKMGSVLVNGLGGHESPGVGVSGTKPLVNGDLRNGEGEAEFGGKSAVMTDTVVESVVTPAGKQGDVAGKVRRGGCGAGGKE